ncbi:MAG: FecR domain-containing protein [Acidobacteriota bacterium]
MLLAIGAAVALSRVAGIASRPRQVVTTGDDAGIGRLGAGQLLETNGRTRAQLFIAELGKVDVDPLSRVRVLVNESRERRLRLERGTIHAIIIAPPRQFFVDTPSASAIDLGCAYTLHVDDDGASLLSVQIGWVAFTLAGRESFVPAGAACASKPGFGPGTPYDEHASSAFIDALASFDAGDAKELSSVLAQARHEDAFTLWHLLSRVDPGDRGQVFERLGMLVPPPAGVTRAGIERADRGMLDAWWDALGLGTTSFWRHWEGPSPFGGKTR